MSKTSNKWMSVKFLGQLDAIMFFTYSLSQFMTGYLADKFDKIKILILSFIFQAIGFLIIGIAE